MRFSRPKTKPGEHYVQHGLSLTPSQMQKMVDQGIPVSTQGYSAIYDKLPSDGVPLEHQRGVDLNDMWNSREDSKLKLRKLKQKLEISKIE